MNNTEMESVGFVGPIPRGKYKIGQAYDHKRLKAVTMNLDPIGHDALGRTYFRIHGDNAKGDMSGSEGCIVLAKDVRIKIDESDCRILNVIE